TNSETRIAGLSSESDDALHVRRRLVASRENPGDRVERRVAMGDQRRDVHCPALDQPQRPHVGGRPAILLEATGSADRRQDGWLEELELVQHAQIDASV